MRKLSDTEVKSRYDLLTKRHRAELAQLVHDAMIGRTMKQLAKLLDRNVPWISGLLEYYAVVVEQNTSIKPPEKGIKNFYPPNEGIDSSSNKPPRHTEVKQVVKQFKPEKPSEEEVSRYELDGHTPEAAKCLASASEARDAAMQKGVVRESKTKEKERVANIILPEGTRWDMDLKSLCARVRVAASILDQAKISDLKKAVTAKKVAEVHSLWMEQIERIINFHPDFEEIK